jgi:probable addiction module antidote protein
MKSKTKRRLGDYHQYLIESLKDSKEAEAYLNAALEEDDPESFLIALKNVVEANGVSKTARLARLNRVSLYKMLSKKGNPSMSSLYSVLRALGLSLRIEKTSEAA